MSLFYVIHSSSFKNCCCGQLACLEIFTVHRIYNIHVHIYHSVLTGLHYSKYSVTEDVVVLLDKFLFITSEFAATIQASFQVANAAWHQ